MLQLPQSSAQITITIERPPIIGTCTNFETFVGIAVFSIVMVLFRILLEKLGIAIFRWKGKHVLLYYLLSFILTEIITVLFNLRLFTDFRYIPIPILLQCY